MSQTRTQILNYMTIGEALHELGTPIIPSTKPAPTNINLVTILLDDIAKKQFKDSSYLCSPRTIAFLTNIARNHKTANTLSRKQLKYLKDLLKLADKDRKAKTPEQPPVSSIPPIPTPAEEPEFISLAEYLARAKNG